MRKFIYVLMSAALVACMTSCNKEDQPNSNINIGFDFIKTKASLIKSALQYNKVYGGEMEITVYDVAMTSPDDVVVPLQTATYNTTSQKFETVHSYAWPVGALNAPKELNFYSWTPKAEGQSDITFDQANETASFTYTAQADTTKQKDIVFGYYKGTGTGTTGVATLDYYHALSAVKFKVGNIPTGATVNSVSITGLVDEGSCSYKFDTHTYTWSDNTTVATTPLVYVPTDDDSTAGYGVVATGSQIGKDAITLVPQEIGSTSAAAITVKITPVGGTETTFVYALKDKSISLEEGKITTFTLNMSSVISFDVTVSAWLDGGTEDINLN